MTLAEAVRLATQRLSGQGRDARILVAHAAKIGVDRLTLHGTDVLPQKGEAHLVAMLDQRARHQPIAQITGQRLFWGRTFRVTPDTLDPRPETETLVAAALERPFVKMLDLGTGTGCILLSCLADRPDAHGIGTDISPAALAVAADNAARLNIAHAIFQHSDWMNDIVGHFDLIVSNPPYIAADEMPALAPDVREWEPHIALTPGGDGLAAYRIIAAQAPQRLLPGGRLLLEIGPTQGQAVTALLAAQGLTNITVRPDMDGRDRVVCAEKP
jgi:release factor glutamine methyltransferase